ncbi:unnamed protein product [Angiostrongylus costaricensis]|uniref:Metalloendopeptidase n=1 Tax=Angiostrongylus costaricensis TaxID=334426 RepID=A0A0R3PY07_ANGCS|nr:unnamed protein product [Angiostrongylus costaricensis]
MPFEASFLVCNFPNFHEELIIDGLNCEVGHDCFIVHALSNMKLIPLICIATFVRSEKSFEEKLKELNQLLKNNYGPIKKTLVKAMGDTIEEVDLNSEIDMALLQGDIILTKEQSDEIIQDIKENEVKLLPEHFGYREQELLTLMHYKMTFFSQVGTALHEIGHTLGPLHTQSRHDRDDFDGWLSQFIKQNENSSYNYNLTYDYGSVMHYTARCTTLITWDFCHSSKYDEKLRKLICPQTLEDNTEQIGVIQLRTSSSTRLALDAMLNKSVQHTSTLAAVLIIFRRIKLAFK